MFGPTIEPLPDDELVAILAAALSTAGGWITRPMECHLAGVAAEHMPKDWPWRA